MKQRRVDELGRVVIPTHLRKQLGLESKTAVSFSVKGDSLIIKKACPTCIICGAVDELKSVDDKYVCSKCISKLI